MLLQPNLQEDDIHMIGHMNGLRLTIFTACMLASSHACAGFTYESRPISPDCLSALVDLYDLEKPQVELSQCSSSQSTHKVSIASDIVTTEDKSQMDPQPYANYSVIGEDGDKYLLGLGQWTGGSGFFSTILWVQVKDSKLTQLKAVASGDRCNGGAYKAGPWQYTVNLTSADLIEFAKNKAIKVQPYIDLDASAAGCIAKAYYMFHPETGTSRLMFVKLDEKAVLSGEWEKQFVTQHCFNTVMSAYISRKETELSANQVAAFAEQYQQQCLKNPKV
jgi:hypothetical protein